MATKRYDPSNVDLRTGKAKAASAPQSKAPVKTVAKPAAKPVAKPAPKPVASAVKGAGIREAITATQRRQRDAGI